ncbi:MAG: YicC/YloC family endoribonuclease [Pseudomonadota bacterium]
MTGYASQKGAGGGFSWMWELRSVNARGFDLRLRVPDWVEGLEAQIRKSVTQNVTRGNVTIGLKLTRDEADTGEAIDPEALARVLDDLKAVAAAAETAGLPLSPITAADILSLRGVMSAATPETDQQALLTALMADLPAVIAAFSAMRQSEGAALGRVIANQIDQIAALTETAAAQADDRKDAVAARLKDNLARILENADSADPDRVAQELALIAVKADVTEELDRLRTHVDAARALLSQPAVMGRKLDFLAQEFNREANTLCSKSQSAALTQTGLELKAVIDQMREQIQNVE